jgi:epoxyqueuosine reductase
VTTPFPSDRIKDQARRLGFNLAGITRAVASPHLQAYLGWLELGRHAELGYMARPDRVARRRDLNVILPGVRSLVIVGLDYHSLKLPPALLDDPARGRIAAYAWGQDYHDLMLPRLKSLGEWLQAEAGRSAGVRVRAYVDTGAILERSHAQQAGLGFIGKNTMLINPRRGSDFFLGEVLTTAEFDVYDQPARESMCGSCTRCLAACPTDAFPEPYVLDARRCISYLTIEHPGWIERGLRPLMGNWVFGCDICQVVCPWQRFAVQTLEGAFYPPDPDRAAPPLERLLRLDQAGFEALFGGTPVERAGLAQMLRNAAIAAANGRQTALSPLLEDLLAHPASAVRGHAAWALARLLGSAARPALQAALARETDPLARADVQQTLSEITERAG